jgi:hypothetical protein
VRRRKKSNQSSHDPLKLCVRSEALKLANRNKNWFSWEKIFFIVSINHTTIIHDVNDVFLVFESVTRSHEYKLENHIKPPTQTTIDWISVERRKVVWVWISSDDDYYLNIIDASSSFKLYGIILILLFTKLWENLFSARDLMRKSRENDVEKVKSRWRYWWGVIGLGNKRWFWCD